jgi:hypothetical protein
VGLILSTGFASAEEPLLTPAAEPSSPTAAAASPNETAATPKEEKDDRSLRDHEFIFPQFVDSALVATYVGLRLRLGESKIPNLPTAFGSRDLHAVTNWQVLDAGFKLTDWLGISVSVGGHSVLSTNIPSLVYQGASFWYGGNAGGILRLLRSDHTGTQLSLRGSGGYTDGVVNSFASVFATADSPVALRTLVTAGLAQAIKTPIHTYNAEGSFALAQSFGPLLGLQAILGLGWSKASVEPLDLSTGNRPTLSSSGLSYRAGVAASVDFMSLHVPVAVVGEYLLLRTSSPADLIASASRNTTSTLFAGVYYSGRPNLQLGIGGGATLGLGEATLKNGSSDSAYIVLGQLDLRYVW